ncbi:MAG TPA: AglZ/HisF2 family acetamidino modification protein [Usitatibacter sp.]|nr:AglZ/HisF2 family acetamidino modification protein [Usitatibacter sp.]
MSRTRVIPVLLVSDEGLVKTRRFADRRYLGDPINAVKIFNDKMADELVLLDIDATARGGAPDFDRVDEMVGEAFMPVAYGGGVRSVEHFAQLFRRGVEKVVVNTAAFDSPQLVEQAARRFGSQAVVVSLDVRRTLWGKARCYTAGGRRRTRLDPVHAARHFESLGAGELIVTAIECEGTFSGYDLDLLAAVAGAVGIPVIAHGGAGRIEHLVQAVEKAGCQAVAAGSMFVFAAQGQGVLITYPSPAELQRGLWERTSAAGRA